MPFCAAAAIAYGEVGIGTFEVDRMHTEAIRELLPKISLRTNPAFDSKPPLSQSRVTLRLRDGRVLARHADGARGYPGRPATGDQLAAKFADCARRSLAPSLADGAWSMLTRIETTDDVCSLTAALSLEESHVP